MANIFPIDFEEKLTMAQDDYILFSDSEDGNKIKKAQYKNLKGEKGDKGDKGDTGETGPQGPQGIQGIQGPQGEQGEKGDTGDTGATGARIDSAAFSGNDIVFGETDGNTVTLANAKTTLTGPQGPQGEQGIQGEQGEQGIQGVQGDKGDKGDKGDTGSAATISVGTTTTGEPGTDASVTNSGTSSAAVFNFTIPQGAKGDTGATGATGEIGAKINSASFSGDDIVFGLTDSSTVTLTNAVTTLTGPQGEQGIQGEQGPQGETGATGTAATITVGSTTTGNAGTSASVVNSGTSSAAVLDFTIPKGDKGDTGATGATGATGNGIASVTSSKSGKITTVTITETDGDSSSFTVSDGEDGEGAGDVLGPNSSTDGDVVLFDGNTGKLIKDSGKAFTPAGIGALADSTKYGASITVSVDTTDYKITTTLKDQDGNTLGTAQVIDLPLESVVVSGSYDSVNKKIILTLQNGNTIEFSVADLVAGLQSEITSSNKLDADLVDDSTSTNKFVTASDKTTWSGKQDKLIAGTNITIAADGKTISSTDTTYSAASSSSLGLVKLGSDTVQSVAANAVTGTASRTYAMQVNGSGQLVVNIPWTDTTYTAGTGISIEGGVISNTQTSAEWGNITGTLSDQTDLSNALGGKQDTISDLATIRSGASAGATALQPSAISDTAYGSGWDADTTHAPTKNAVYDKLSAMDTTIAGKQAALSTQTAYTSKGTSTKVPTITTNTLGQVTGITETSIAFPVTSVGGSTGAVGLKTINGNSIVGTGDITVSSSTTTTCTLTSAGWSSNSQTVSVTGVTASNTVIVSPAPDDIADYADCGVYGYGQGSGTLTFKCDTAPSGDIVVNVLIMS